MWALIVMIFWMGLMVKCQSNQFKKCDFCCYGCEVLLYLLCLDKFIGFQVKDTQIGYPVILTDKYIQQQYSLPWYLSISHIFFSYILPIQTIHAYVHTLFHYKHNGTNSTKDISSIFHSWQILTGAPGPCWKTRQL